MSFHFHLNSLGWEPLLSFTDMPSYMKLEVTAWNPTLPWQCCSGGWKGGEGTLDRGGGRKLLNKVAAGSMNMGRSTRKGANETSQSWKHQCEDVTEEKSNIITYHLILGQEGASFLCAGSSRGVDRWFSDLAAILACVTTLCDICTMTRQSKRHFSQSMYWSVTCTHRR